jgi:hypothetical protein
LDCAQERLSSGRVWDEGLTFAELLAGIKG